MSVPVAVIGLRGVRGSSGRPRPSASPPVHLEVRSSVNVISGYWSAAKNSSPMTWPRKKSGWRIEMFSTFVEPVRTALAEPVASSVPCEALEVAPEAKERCRA